MPSDLNQEKVYTISINHPIGLRVYEIILNPNELPTVQKICKLLSQSPIATLPYKLKDKL